LEHFPFLSHCIVLYLLHVPAHHTWPKSLDTELVTQQTCSNQQVVIKAMHVNTITINQTYKTSYTALYVLCLYRGGFPHAPRPYMVYCTSPIDIQTSAMRTHRASPLVPPTREQRN
jgi:hypothetical protein